MKKISFYFIVVLSLLVASCSDNFSDGNLLGDSSEDGFFSGNVADVNDSQDTYVAIIENQFIDVEDEAVSTFSIDADGASYSNSRRFLQQESQLPPADAIRTEEFINYFNLDYEFDETSHPIDLNGEIATCPWNPDHQLIRIGIKGEPLPAGDLPASNFVFLIDVSGSMGGPDRLDLLKSGFSRVVDEMSDDDRVAIVTYAGSSGVVLQSTPASDRATIKDAINQLGSGGSTAGAEGILTAYDIARANFIEGGNNRIIVGTDGDFNVGPSSQDELVELIEENRDFGVFLTVIGVGRGNLRESQLEQIANNGNGTFEYADNDHQIYKIFVAEYSRFFSVAKDVKVQVEFNPENVVAYRLIGYENRILNNEDFEDDTEDAGEIGANQSITALYEIVPTGNVDSRFLPSMTVDFRYKQPDSDVSTQIALEIFDENTTFEESSDFMQFTAAVASFALLLRDSEFKGQTDHDQILEWLEMGNIADPFGYKTELEDLVTYSKTL